MCFDVSGIVLQRLGEVVECADRIPPIQIDDSQVAVRFRDVVAFRNSLAVKLGRLYVALLMQHEGLFEWSQQARDLATDRSKQTKLTLEFRLDLFDGQTLRAHFAHAAKERERLEI